MDVTNLRQSLMQRFVPSNIALNTITRQIYIERHVIEFDNMPYKQERILPVSLHASMEPTASFQRAGSFVHFDSRLASIKDHTYLDQF